MIKRPKSIGERIEDERERQMAKYEPIMARLYDPYTLPFRRRNCRSRHRGGHDGRVI